MSNPSQLTSSFMILPLCLLLAPSKMCIILSNRVWLPIYLNIHISETHLVDMLDRRGPTLPLYNIASKMSLL